MAVDLDIVDGLKKRGVMDLPSWGGWDWFMQYYQMAHQAKYPEDSKLYFTSLFETGCRRSEVIKIKVNDIAYNDEGMVIYNAPVLKKKKKTTRNIYIRGDMKHNPLYPHFLNMVKGSMGTYLLPARKRFSRELIPDKATSHMTVYNRITEISPDLFPHALRSYRASMLAYERGYSIQDLVKWFEWDSQGGVEMAVHYTAQVDLARKAGFTRAPMPGEKAA